MRSILIGLLVLSSSCGTSSTTYVGSVAGTDVAVGLVTDGTHTALFFCGGSTSFATSTKWLRFTESGGAFTATKDAWTAQGTASGASASGTVDRGDGVALPWSATRAPDGSAVGLYESVTPSGTAGVVVRSETDVQGAIVRPQSAVEQIIPIFPLAVGAEGLHVRIAGFDAFVPRANAD